VVTVSCSRFSIALANGRNRSRDAIADLMNTRLIEVGKQRQCEQFSGSGLGDRQSLCRLGKGRLEVTGNRIVDSGPDMTPREGLSHLFTVGNSYDIQVMRA
jgi:hypothetical protein